MFDHWYRRVLLLTCAPITECDLIIVSAIFVSAIIGLTLRLHHCLVI